MAAYPYSTSRWLRLAAKIRARDGMICQRTGIALTGGRRAPNSAVVDHIIPHKLDERLIWDEANLQTVSKQYHDSIKQRMERQSKRIERPDGWDP